MKTINVSTTKSTDTTTETRYATNWAYGISIDEERDYQIDKRVVKCIVTVGAMFPGTPEEWDKHIIDCCINALEKEGLTHETEDGIIYLNKQCEEE